MKTTLNSIAASITALVAVLTLVICSSVQAQEILNPSSLPPAVRQVDSSKTAAVPKPRMSATIAEILRMHEAGLSPDVIKSYAANAAIAQPPSAKEIMHLHDRGIPSEVITILIQRGGEMRKQSQAALAVPGQRAAPLKPPEQSAPLAQAPAASTTADDKIVHVPAPQSSQGGSQIIYFPASQPYYSLGYPNRYSNPYYSYYGHYYSPPVYGYGYHGYGYWPRAHLGFHFGYGGRFCW